MEPIPNVQSFIHSNMPVAPVDSVGTVLYYEDSGVPLGDSLYTSIVLSHGAAFHSGELPFVDVQHLLWLIAIRYTSGVFHRMVPYAAQNNLRLFLVNSRDYPGSSPFSPAEFDALGSSDRLVQAKAIQKQGVELAAFLIYLIEEHDIPPITTLGDGTLTGGLAVLSWSLGTLVPTAFLAHADALPTKTQHRLQSHLRSVVLLGE